MMETRQVAHLTWDEYASAVSDGILILPAGSTEQHSTHLPLGVDTIIPENIALTLAERVGALVAPVLPYGYKSQPSSGGGPLFPGTIDLNGATMTGLVKDLLTEFLADGWRKIFILNGHFENVAFLIEATDLILRNQKERFPKVVIASWWENISPELLPRLFDEFPFPGWALEHAAVLETSVMMYLMPELVHEDRFREEGLESSPTYHGFPPTHDLLPASGTLHTPRSSSVEKGRLIMENVVNNLEQIIKKEFR